MKIAITGGSGFIGSALSALLREGGSEVVSLSRKDADVTGNRLSGIFNGCDCVVHLVGIIRESGKSFDDVMVTGTKNVLNECRNAGVKKIVYISASGVSLSRKERYYRAKLGAEKAIAESGIPYAILRPSIVYGPRGELTKMLKRLLAFPIVPVFGDGKYELQPIHVDDLARCIANAIGKNGVFEVGGNEKISFKSLVTMMAKSVDKNPIFIHIPLWVARPIASIMSLIPFSPITREQLEILINGNVCRENRIAELGVSPRPFNEGINFTKR
ncbi:MAG: NAD-dependent epimerase/dehydratase family protein [Candidatus Aenigmarchaeota archaeon]|nr:NAD-dependent epimerase/dehydratase family protein [Candidatus Aenigmarchaeota archaeon]